MLGFMGGGPIGKERFGLPAWIERWDALDVQVEQNTLDRYSYSDYFQTDVEQAIDLKKRRYHAVVLLHVLEHLADPEDAMLRIAGSLQDGGLLLGGSPTMPASLAAIHEPWLRRKYRHHGVLEHRHLSVITPARIRRFARTSNFQIELLSGAFLWRWSGFFLEDFAWCTRGNLLWGAAFPSLGGEVYFSLRAPDKKGGS